MRILFNVVVLFLAMMSCACSTFETKIVRAEGTSLYGLKTFRMNYYVYDEEGNDITEDTVNKHQDNWSDFCKMCDYVQSAFKKKGYQWIYAPNRTTDFMVNVCVSAYYSETIDQEQMMEQDPATFLIGKKDGDNCYHVVIIHVLASVPDAPDEMVVLWEGRGICHDFVEIDKADTKLIPLIDEIMDDFPRARQK